MDQALQTQPENYAVWQPCEAMLQLDVVCRGRLAYADWQPPFPGTAHAGIWAELTSVEGYAVNHYGLPLGLPLFISGLQYPQAITGNIILPQVTACDGEGPTGLLYAISSSRGMEHGEASAEDVFGGHSVVPHANHFSGLQEQDTRGRSWGSA